ncbi:hypothetical protein [Oceanidesulfovibrio indonesiensis]|uniref:hypothetical protein n=1 Tax=Oceanidesulfovibrio indonesiensis TaxID=54767 RepID=UPI001186BBEF|nr:hypothetical protein [Oceanidesulfovibrio indonesiensis]
MNAWRGIDPVEASNRLAVLEKKLEYCDEMLSIHDELLQDEPDSVAYGLSSLGIKDLRREVQNEIVQLMMHRIYEPVSVEIKGSGFDFKSANIRALSRFMNGLQSLFTSIYQSVTVGPKNSGRFSKDIELNSTLHLSRVYESSFGMDLFVETDTNLLPQNPVIESFSTLFDALNNLTSNYDEFMSSAAVMGKRSIDGLHEVVSCLADYNANISVKWQRPSGGSENWIAKADTLSDVVLRTDLIKIEEVIKREIRGKLLGASLIKRKFELLTGDGETIAGKVPMVLLDSITDCFAKECVAFVTERRIIDQLSGKVQSSVSLDKIKKR